MDDAERVELLRLNQRLLESIATADWATYTELCDPGLTCFEPEALGHLVAGMSFHEFYFKLDAAGGHTTMSSPSVRLMGDVGVVAYVRLSQRLTAEGIPVTFAFEETRVWQKQNGRWRHVHFHRSRPTS